MFGRVSLCRNGQPLSNLELAAGLQRTAKPSFNRRHRGVVEGAGFARSLSDDVQALVGGSLVSFRARLGQKAQQLEGDGGADQRRVAGLVEGWRDLHHVGADKVEMAEAAHQLQRLAAGEAADLRRAGAGREGRIDGVDVEGEIGRRRADDLPRLGDRIGECPSRRPPPCR